MTKIHDLIVRTILLAYVISLAGGLFAPCASDAAGPSAVASSSEQEHLSHANAHHAPSQDDRSAGTIESPCCDECASLCPANSGTSGGNDLAADAAALWLDRAYATFVDRTPAAPAPRPLYRPPITHA